MTALKCRFLFCSSSISKSSCLIASEWKWVSVFVALKVNSCIRQCHLCSWIIENPIQTHVAHTHPSHSAHVNWWQWRMPVCFGGLPLLPFKYRPQTCLDANIRNTVSWRETHVCSFLTEFTYLGFILEKILFLFFYVFQGMQGIKQKYKKENNKILKHV